jgi:glucose-1-phosphate thymidylyltransferase
MKAILLCAGYATRLRPLTDDCPKHLLEVGGKTILDHVVDKISRLPLESIYVVTNNKFFTHFESWRVEHYQKTLPLEVINDGTLSNEDRLGSIGDVEFVLNAARIDGDVLIVNADNLFTFDLKPIHDRFLEKKNVIACYDVGEVAEARKMGVPTTDGEGRIIDFVEKPENPSSTEVAIGIYFYSREGTALIRAYVKELRNKGLRPDTTGDFVGWLAGKLPVYTYTYSAKEETWVDIGTPEQYENARTSSLFS